MCNDLIKTWVNLNLSEGLRGLIKEGIEEIKLLLHHQTLDISTKENSRLSGDFFGVHLLIFNFKF